MAALDEGKSSSVVSVDGEAPPASATDRRRGAWAAAPFIIATEFVLTLASGSWSANLIVFLITEFNINRIDAAQISNIIAGCANFFPLIGAVVADSLLGCFSVIWISCVSSLLGLILLVLSVTVDGLKPHVCQQQQPSNLCAAAPSRTQYAFLYSAISLATVGLGGTRFTLATLGANQFAKTKQHPSFFNWYFIGFYTAAFISSTGVVYVQDNVGWGWGWGFGIGLAANALALAIFFAGTPYYCRDKPRASPFTALLRVAVASVRKRKRLISSQTAHYYYGDNRADDAHIAPTNWFRQLNRAALMTEGDILPNGSIASPWKLCSVEQVEDLKSLIKILPLWSSNILIGTPIGVQYGLTVLQALAADRRLGHSFQFSAGSMPVFSLISPAIGLVLIDYWFRPMWKKKAGKNPTPLQQIGVGHVFNIGSMAVSALVESRRRRSAAPGRHLMSAMWLVPQMVIVGIGEAFQFPGQVGLYYQEFPSSLKSLATAMAAMLIGVAFYLSTAVVDLIRRATDWLPDNIDHGRVDNVYWVMVAIGTINFGYFLVISWLWNYKNVDEYSVNKDQTVSCNEEL